ncbi:uncharacterized protein LOC134542937 [Bacillus rossius redtenbacheri]|uniref:uncharacterized protein LOC134542937 n=1 Tax=Bacillus rossius redtenbacheri TaxID=93214 RepID=UPI002FDD317C
MVHIQSNNCVYDVKAEMQDQVTMKAKKDKKGKKRKAEGGDEVKNDGVAASEDSPAAKRTKKFSMKLYHEHMKKNPITALMEFVSACDAGESDRRDVVRQFLSGGGKPGEVVKLLHSAGDSEKEALVFPVFSALKHLLTCYMVVEPAHQESLEKASWQVLSAHSAVVQQALAATRRADACKAVLTVLAAMATISPRLAKEVLTRVGFTPKLAAALAKPPPAGNTSSVRSCFVQLLVAFLITDDASVIGQLCSRKDLLASVVPDLASDPADTVLLLVTSLRCRLVESKAVSKSVKMAVFKTATLHGLLALYRWVGPRARGAPDAEVDEETRQRVALAAHGLLLVLCTSHRLGVLFPCRGKSPASGNHNKLVATLFQKLEEPWQHELQRELALKTLVACPHLVHGFLPRLRDSLRPADSLRWHRACAFYQQLVESLDPEPCVQSDDVLRSVVTLMAPPAVLGVVGGQGLLHGRSSVRHRLAALLCSMLRAAERLLACAEARRPGDAPALRSQLAAHLAQHLPSGGMLARAWALALAAPEDEEDEIDAVREPSPQEHLAVLLDLLEACGRACPALLSGTALQPRALLADVHALCADGRLVAKALAVLFSLDPAGFSQDTELLRTAVGLLLGLAAGTDPDAARPVLLQLLGRTGLFAAHGREPQAWLRCYLDARPEARPGAARLLADALALVAGDPRLCWRALAGTAPARRLDAVFRELLDGADAPTDETLALGFSLSPLLPGVLQLAEGSSDTDPEVVAFISRAVVHLLHSQASADVVWHLLKGREHLVLPAVLKYVRGWLPDSVPKPLRKPFGA